MSNETEVQELKTQIAALTERINDLVTDNDESLRQLAVRINEYCKRCDLAVTAVHSDVAESLTRMAAELRHTGELLRSDVYNSFSKDVAATITSSTIADSLSKSLKSQVIITRPASRAEMSTAVVTRLAQPHELK